MELRIVEFAWMLLRPRGFLRRVAIAFAAFVGLIAFWGRAVNLAPEATRRREASRRRHARLIAARMGAMGAAYDTEVGAEVAPDVDPSGSSRRVR